MIARYSLPQMNSLWQDESKFSKMLEIELATVEALSKLKKIPQDAVKRIRKKAKFNLSQINRLEEKTNHDVIAFVTNVNQYLGQDAKYFHMGLTSSDLLDTALAMQMVQGLDILIKDNNNLIKILSKKALKYKDMVCIGRTHGVHAEPITFGLKLLLWLDEAKRNSLRLEEAKKNASFGKLSGAVGTYSNIEPFVEEYVCKKLGLKRANIATQVIQRDIHAQVLSTIAIVGASLEKFAQEIRHLQKTEVLEAEEPFGKWQKGSSAMPHKRNPVICERICGLARLLRTNALAGIENIALWHERDISHSSVERIIIPDSFILLDYMFYKLNGVLEGLIVYPENMLSNLIKTKGLIFSQRVLVTLMKKGLTRTKAYDLVQKNAMRCWKETLDFKEILNQDKNISRYLTKDELEDCFDLNYYLRNVDKIFKRFNLSKK